MTAQDGGTNGRPEGPGLGQAHAGKAVSSCIVPIQIVLILFNYGILNVSSRGVVRVSDSQCKLCTSPGFDPSILRSEYKERPMKHCS